MYQNRLWHSLFQVNNLLQIIIWFIVYVDVETWKAIQFLTTILPILFQYCYKYCYSDNRNRNEIRRFGALKSDSTHHLFGNACTKSGSVRFSQFSGCWLIFSVYIPMSFDFPFWKIVRSSVILLLPLFHTNVTLINVTQENKVWIYIHQKVFRSLKSKNDGLSN